MVDVDRLEDGSCTTFPCGLYCSRMSGRSTLLCLGSAHHSWERDRKKRGVAQEELRDEETVARESKSTGGSRKSPATVNDLTSLVSYFGPIYGFTSRARAPGRMKLI